MTTTYTPPPPPPPTQPPVVPAATPPPQKSGCWKWGLIGCGCLTAAVAAFVVVLVVFVFGVIKKSDVYKEALSRVQSDPRVVAALGSPVEPGFMVTGSVHADTEHGGNAEINFPVHGPKGQAKVRAVATRENDVWKYETLRVTPDGGSPIDLATP